MSKKIFVGNLPLSITNERLNDFFSPVGTVVSAKVVMGIDGKTAAGYGYVLMSNDAETQNSIKKLNGAKLNGCIIKVIEAHPIDQDNSYMFRHYRSNRIRRR